MNHGQISIEYLIILGTVLLLVIIPAGAFLTDFALDSIYGSVDTQRANELGQGLIDIAQQVYYLGLYSKKQVTLSVPKNVERMYLLNVSKSQDHHYIVIKINDSSTQRYTYPSKAPLTADPSSTYVNKVDYSSDVDACSSNPCSFLAFTEPVTRPGRFQLETVLKGNDIIVNVAPVIQ